MMLKTWKKLGAILFSCVILCAVPLHVHAAESDSVSGPAISLGDYVVTVKVDSVNINKDMETQEVLCKAAKNSSYKVVKDLGNGWLKIEVKGQYGYIPLDGNTVVTAGNTVNEIVTGPVASEDRRQALVDFAVQFVGGSYRYGGSDPRTGVDCSGFTSYVMKYGAGVQLNRSSGSQALQGVSISADQMRPGDLIFYGSSRNINHVAMYIGNGQIVHSSTYQTGIKISVWNYKTPVKIVNVLGD